MNRAGVMAGLASRLRFGLVAAGWPGALGIVLALAGGIVQYVLVPQQQLAAESARAAAEQQRRAYLAAAASGGHNEPAGAAESLARFRAGLMPEAKADEALEIIQRDARARGLLSSATEYKWQRLPAARLAEIQITLPVKGGYGPLRSFLGDVLADVPGLALEQCDLQRDNVATLTTDARLRFTLFLRTGA